MAYVRFATICDHCNSKGAEYSAHTVTCRECLDDVCAKCTANYEPDPECPNVCNRCDEESALAPEIQ